MKKVQKTFALTFIALTLVLATSGCAKPQPAGLNDVRVSAMVENILQAINAGNPQNFTQDFSDAMKSAFPETEFNKLRDMIQKTSGTYLSMSSPTLLNQNGYAIYHFPCKFEKEDVIVTVTFTIGGDKVEGLFFDSTNLRSASK
jgi:Protein of unknown function (DUF3887)